MVDDKLEKFLKSWIDGELEPEQAADVAAYLKSNPRAQAKVSDYRRVAAVIRKVAKVTPIPMPRPVVIRRRALRREQEERQVIQWLQRLTAAAAILLVTTLGMLFASTMTTGDTNLAAQVGLVVSTTARPDLDGKTESAILPEHAPLLDQAMILALNDPSWEMPYR